MSFKIFISYSTKDVEHINPILSQLSTIQNTEIFYADKTLNPGDNIDQIIINNIKNSDVFLMFNSESALKSNYVQQEIGVAKSNNKIIIPILLDSNKPTAMLNGINYLNFYDQSKKEAEFDRLYNYIIRNVQSKNQNQLLTFLGILGIGYLLSRSEDENEDDAYY
ncbi:toll/interleukin-1 receptor domain-containing protein [Methanococcoides sp. FTZ1]|uniref:toll/interleukin-1 receptor domain-containing protein n=1 Tax=Methanococcoides sp. FTZ1 TaxID=3439061 RepID=UPI003F851A29